SPMPTASSSQESPATIGKTISSCSLTPSLPATTALPSSKSPPATRLSSSAQARSGCSPPTLLAFAERHASMSSTLSLNASKRQASSAPSPSIFSKATPSSRSGSSKQNGAPAQPFGRKSRRAGSAAPYTASASKPAPKPITPGRTRSGSLTPSLS